MITLNQVIETLAPVIAEKNDYRAVIEYTNGDTVLLDFSNNGKPFEDTNRIMVWSYQSNIYLEDGSYGGSDEVDYGIIEDNYYKAFELVLSLLNNQQGVEVDEFYYESF